MNEPAKSVNNLADECKRDSLFKEPLLIFLLDSLQIHYPNLSSTKLDLFRAKVLFELHREKAGLKQYWSAINSIQDSSDADAIFNDLCYIMTDAEYSKLQQTSPGDLDAFYKSFWIKRDPNLTTEQNERIIEHYRRVAYAHKHYHRTVDYSAELSAIYSYKHPFRDYLHIKDLMGDAVLAAVGFPEAIPGNRQIDDLGLVYVRHGKPDKKAVSVAQNIDFSDLPPKLASFFSEGSDASSVRLQQLYDWHYGLDVRPMNVS